MKSFDFDISAYVPVLLWFACSYLLFLFRDDGKPDVRNLKCEMTQGEQFIISQGDCRSSYLKQS
jgi:hypothetical protein